MSSKKFVPSIRLPKIIRAASEYFFEAHVKHRILYEYLEAAKDRKI
jgi:hypothetical protein